MALNNGSVMVLSMAVVMLASSLPALSRLFRHANAEVLAAPPRALLPFFGIGARQVNRQLVCSLPELRSYWAGAPLVLSALFVAGASLSSPLTMVIAFANIFAAITFGLWVGAAIQQRWECRAPKSPQRHS